MKNQHLAPGGIKFMDEDHEEISPGEWALSILDGRWGDVDPGVLDLAERIKADSIAGYEESA